jgi:Glycosyl transferase 4-like domain/Glycosyl transferases group 1
MSARPTLLVFSYYYAPSPLVGAKRFSFLVREFTAQGYDVHVFTNELVVSHLGPPDASLPLAGTVHRVANPFKVPIPGTGWFTRKLNGLLRRLLVPCGPEYFWSRAATKRALDVAHDLPRGIVMATSPPHAPMFAAARVARKLGWPLVLDYRDPWSAYEWPRWRRGPLAQRVSRRIEGRLIRRSAARVLNTAAMRQWFERIFPDTPAARNFVVPNGFDPRPTAAPPPASGPLEIVHAGEIYTGRSLVPVLRAARALQRRFPDRPIRVITYGDLPPPEWQRVRESGLEDSLRVLPRIPFADLFARLQSAHVLLAIVSDHMLYSTPYKVYDYMAAGRPILGLAPTDASLCGLLAESGAGRCVEPEDTAAIESALEAMLYPVGSEASPHTERFHWSNLALQYSDALDAVSSQASAAAPDTSSRTRPAGKSASAP